MDWLGDNQWAAWLGVAMLLGVGEMFSLDLVLAMLALGAMAGMVAAVLSAPVVVQVLVAAGGALATLAVLRPPLVKRLHGGPELTLGTAKLIGRQGTVLRGLSGLEPGLVRIDGEEWTAAPYDESLAIEIGETIEVLEIRGATAYVHPVPRLDP